MRGYLNTLNRTYLAVGLCDRCHQKFPLEELLPDPNSPGLRVCVKDQDVIDPYRMPSRPADQITLQYPRPDEALT